jgi:replicative DNA helicase
MTDFYPPEPPNPSGLPHSREAEEACIGAVLINADVYLDLAQFLKPNDFYIHRLRFIWESYIRLHERRIPVDILTVSEELNDMGHLEEVGGQAYLTALLNRVPTTLHAEAYGRIVQAASTRRKLLVAANQIAILAYDANMDIEKVSVDAVTTVTDAVDIMLVGENKTSRQAFSEAYDRIDGLSKQPVDLLPGISTGMIDLDHKLGGGLKKGKFYLAAGRPGTGKTSLLLTILHHAAYDRRKKCALFSLEMPTEENVDRLLSMDAEIDGQIIQSGKLDDDLWPIFNHSVETGGDTNIFFDDTPSLSPLQLRTRCKRLHAQFGLDLVIIDYLGLMASDGLYPNNREQEVSYISRSLKSLARELNVPVLAAHQLNRAVEQRASNEPILSDLRDSGSLEQDGDVVIFIYEDKEMANISHLKLAKHRGGPTGYVDLVFRRNLTKFVSAVSRRLDQ